ncbi:DUF983 domain-containing protein [Maritalea sp. S77]|uniref:DUF983 domain-containing protein n=1 Tax=Maritalea sp. S77 TaxID=3415125 RepID=UPI003C7AF9BD
MSLEMTTGIKPKRSIWSAMKNGMKCKCPKCGEGKLFRAYLKVNDTCPKCGEELYHHRADDAPPYITMAIVGHIIVGAILHIDMAYEWDPMLYLYVFVPMALFSSLAMLPSIKGSVVAIQWATYLHGFDPEHTDEIDGR